MNTPRYAHFSISPKPEKLPMPPINWLVESKKETNIVVPIIKTCFCNKCDKCNNKRRIKKNLSFQSIDDIV